MVINLRRRTVRVWRRWNVRAKRGWPVYGVNYRRRSDWPKGGMRYRCFLNGEEVTTRTFYVDSRRGIVRMYVYRDGKPVMDRERMEPATEERRGYVKLIRRKQVA